MHVAASERRLGALEGRCVSAARLWLGGAGDARKSPMAVRRIQKEQRDVARDPIPGITAHVVSDNDLFR